MYLTRRLDAEVIYILEFAWIWGLGFGLGCSFYVSRCES